MSGTTNFLGTTCPVIGYTLITTEANTQAAIIDSAVEPPAYAITHANHLILMSTTHKPIGTLLEATPAILPGLKSSGHILIAVGACGPSYRVPTMDLQ